jgi:hypothetical protein
MRIVIVSGTLEALAPITHFGDEKTGSSPILRTLSVYEPSINDIIDLPVLSGNAIRGMLRRLLITDLLQQLEFTNPSTKLHHCLYTGGVLESSSDTYGTIDLNLKNRVRESLPPLALFGTAIGNQMIQGCLRVEFAFPVCRERLVYLPPELANDPRAQKPAREFTSIVFKTRRDDLRAERDEDEQAVQMKVDYEAFIPGTLFTHRFVLTYPNELELSCFAHLLELWREQPYVGGKLASGHGLLRIQYDYPYTPDAYLHYLTNNKPQIVQLLTELGEKLGA